MAEDSGISWHVDTHEEREHGVDWYWGMGLAAVAGAGLSIFLGNFFLAVILVLGATLLGVLKTRDPREHSVAVSPRGISLDGTLYRWNSLDSFWVEEAVEPRLLVSTHGVLHPQLIIPIGDPTRAASVRSYLRRYLKEEEQEPHMGEYVVEMLGL